ncbi:ABC transporter permease [Marichromatium sp. AB31]|uniref:ABC transporter permease n=1 Tax=Marichromatium sp. AB31 TaxID=2483362 RepID=UPI001680EBAE|nr:ABC transporter permease [Marichromatium sp.]
MRDEEGDGVRLAVVVLLVWCGAALFAPWLVEAPNRVELRAMLAGPMPGAPLGTDDLGRLVHERLLVGARVSLLVGVGVVAFAASLGTLVGLVAGLLGGWVDRLVVRLIDLFLAFPGILLAIALAGLLGPGLDNLVIALTVVGWVGYARLARAQALTLAGREHVLAARALGCGTWRILWRHLLPLALAPLLVEATFGIAAAIVAEAGLSFLGLGIQPPDASWGSMLRDGVSYLLVAPHLVIAPGVALFAVTLAVNLVGDWLRDRLDVRTRARDVT